MPIKLVAVDVDGTLITNDQRLTERTKAAIRRAEEAGIQFVLCTGRIQSELKRLFAEIPCMHYAILCSGAVILDMNTGKVLRHIGIEADEARKIYARLRPFDSLISVFADETGYVSAEMVEQYDRFFPPELKELLDTSRQPLPDLDAFMREREIPITKFFNAYPDPAQRDMACEAVKDMGYFVAGVGPASMEITRADVDKGTGLALLTEMLGLTREETMAIGDSDNDRKMLEQAGYRAVMENGLEELKKTADFIAPSNENDGVAWILEQLAEGKLIS